MDQELSEQYFIDLLRKNSDERERIMGRRSKFRTEKMRLAREAHSREMEHLKLQLAETHGIPINDKFNIAWALAVDRADNTDCIADEFANLLPLIK